MISFVAKVGRRSGHGPSYSIDVQFSCGSLIGHAGYVSNCRAWLGMEPSANGTDRMHNLSTNGCVSNFATSNHTHMIAFTRTSYSTTTMVFSFPSCSSISDAVSMWMRVRSCWLDHISFLMEKCMDSQSMKQNSQTHSSSSPITS